MPKFVPVTDTERPQSEQHEVAHDYAQHRKFDAPHAVKANENRGRGKVDRGWQEGTVGWGVLGSFGSNDKDDAAQVVRRSAGEQKMVKNEKGLWVKAGKGATTASDQDQQRVSALSSSASSSGGIGRGGGIPIFNSALNSIASSSSSTNGRGLAGEARFSDRESKVDSTAYDYSDRQYNNDRRGAGRDSRDKRDHDRRSGRDRDRDRDTERERDRDRFDDRRREDRNRDKDRDRERDRYGWDDSRGRGAGHMADTSKDKRYSRDERDTQRRRRSRSRSRSSDRYRRQDNPDFKRDRDTRSQSPYDHFRHISGGKSAAQEVEVVKDGAEGGVEEDDDGTAAAAAAVDTVISSDITAVQVINQFHDMYSSRSGRRLPAIGELFAVSASICSFKSGKVFVDGKGAIENSFIRTNPAPVFAAHRVFIDPSISNINKSNNSSSSSSTSVEDVTFCLDFHTAGKAPGLGDQTKDNVLLYRCQAATITKVWGMVDAEKLAANEELTEAAMFRSATWRKAVELIAPDFSSILPIPEDLVKIAVFHNYYKMEVWG